MNVHGEIKRMTNVLKTTYSRLKRLDSELLEMTNPPKKTAELQTPPSLAKGTSVPKVKEQVGDVSDTPSKRKEIPPLQSEGGKKRNIKSRKEKLDKTTTFSEKIRMELSGDVAINARVQLITLEITRLDGTATKEEVHDAVMRALGERNNVDLEVVDEDQTRGGKLLPDSAGLKSRML